MNVSSSAAAAPRIRAGSKIQYSGSPMTTTTSRRTPISCTRSRRRPSNVSSSKYGLRLGASSISEPTALRAERPLRKA